jgi:hypothetical protein
LDRRFEIGDLFLNSKLQCSAIAGLAAQPTLQAIDRRSTFVKEALINIASSIAASMRRSVFRDAASSAQNHLDFGH